MKVIENIDLIIPSFIAVLYIIKKYFEKKEKLLNSDNIISILFESYQLNIGIIFLLYPFIPKLKDLIRFENLYYIFIGIVVVISALKSLRKRFIE